MDANKLKGKSQNEQVGEIWKFLEHLSQSNPEKYSEFIKKTLDDGAKEGLGPPEPSFCIETHKVPKRIPLRSFYINACKWKQVPAPKSTDSPIPMTASELREELIDGKLCYVVDVALNPSILHECLIHVDDKEVLIDVLIRYVDALTKTKLSSDYKILEDDYKGNKDSLLDMMCPDALKSAARDLSTPLSDKSLFESLKKMNIDQPEDETTIFDSVKNDNLNVQDILLPKDVRKDDCFLSESKEQPKKLPAIGEDAEETLSHKMEDARYDTKKLVEPEYTTRIEPDGTQDLFVIDFDLPHVTTMRDCDVHITESSIDLLVPGKYQLHINMDRKIDEETADAVFVRKTSKLIIKMKCL